MLTRNIQVAGIDTEIDDAPGNRLILRDAGWSCIADKVIRATHGIPTELRMLACAPEDMAKFGSMTAYEAFAVHDDVPASDPRTLEVLGQRVMVQEPAAARFLRLVRDWQISGWQGVPRQSLRFLPTKSLGSWWIFWAAAGTPIPANIREA